MLFLTSKAHLEAVPSVHITVFSEGNLHLGKWKTNKQIIFHMILHLHRKKLGSFAVNTSVKSSLYSSLKCCKKNNITTKSAITICNMSSELSNRQVEKAMC